MHPIHPYKYRLISSYNGKNQKSPLVEREHALFFDKYNDGAGNSLRVSLEIDVLDTRLLIYTWNNNIPDNSFRNSFEPSVFSYMPFAYNTLLNG